MALSIQLTTLESSGLIHLAQSQPEIEYLFRHVLVQEAAYSSLVKQDRRHLHLAAGEALERMYAGRLEELTPMLAHHFSEAGDDERALKYFTLAGDAAARVYANAEAVMHYGRALEIARGPASERWHSSSTAVPTVAGNTELLTQLFTNRGRALELTGLYIEALAGYSDMEALARERGDRTLEMTALILRATIHSTPTPRFDPEQGQMLLDQALAMAHELGDRVAEVRILRNLMRFGTFQGRPIEMVGYGERALALARELNLREDLAYTLNDINTIYLFLGETGRARAALDEARELWRELGNLPMLADSLASSAGLETYAGEYDRAIPFFEEARRLSESIGNLWGQSYSRYMLDFIYWERGELERAITVASECISLAEQAGFIVPLVQIRGQLGLAYGFLGDSRRALEHVRLAITTAEQRAPDWKSMPLAMLARVHLLNGNLAAAEITVREAEQTNDPGAFGFLGDFFLAEVQAELALAQGDYERVLSRIDEFQGSMLSAGAARIFLPDVLLLEGRALSGLGRADEAYATLSQARAEAEALGSRRALWPILAALSEIQSQLGNREEAKALRQQARGIVEYIADHAPPELRDSFLDRPDVRKVTATFGEEESENRR